MRKWKLEMLHGQITEISTRITKAKTEIKMTVKKNTHKKQIKMLTTNKNEKFT